MVKIDIEKTGFPVTIGDVELWFDSSIESLEKFTNIEEISKVRLREISETANHIHFPEEINEETIKDVEDKTIQEALSLSKELIAIQYDLIFGNGTFKTLYEKYPDIFALEKALNAAGKMISEKMDEHIKEMTVSKDKIKKEMLNKKNKKTGVKHDK